VSIKIENSQDPKRNETQDPKKNKRSKIKMIVEVVRDSDWENFTKDLKD
jgi:hypothetical protein